MDTRNLTLASQLWPDMAAVRWRRMAVLAVLGSLFVAICAQINVPMLPVPMTLQTFAVLIVGAAFGSRLGAATLTLYMLEGLAGLPVFAEFKSGPAVLVGPTGGYIVGFIIAAALVGWFAERGFDRNIWKMLLAMLCGAVSLYVPGLLWLAHLIGWGPAVQYGLLPFVAGDLVKAALAAAAFPAAWSLLGSKS